MVLRGPGSVPSFPSTPKKIRFWPHGVYKGTILLEEVTRILQGIPLEVTLLRMLVALGFRVRM